MARQLGMLAVVVPILWASGCAMCCAPYDDNYPAIGGRWVRDNPAHGRVGSAFDPAGHRVEGDVLANEPTPAQPMQPGVRSLRPARDGASYLPAEE